MAPRDLINHMVAFYRSVSFSRRKQGTTADMLLFQTSSPPDGPAWSLDVTRQLYSRGRGHQLGVTIAIPREALPFPGAASLWSKDATDLDDWAAQAHAQVAALGPLPAGPVSLLRAEF